jgi:arabinoxylan arabinofuranohydrolase
MVKGIGRMFLSLSMSVLFLTAVFADNPIIQTNYTADPAPLVVGDTVYLYTSHDEDYAQGFVMNNWMLYTSTDLVNWTDHGKIASLKNFSWENGSAWAPQCVFRNGKY